MVLAEAILFLMQTLVRPDRYSLLIHISSHSNICVIELLSSNHTFPKVAIIEALAAEVNMASMAKLTNNLNQTFPYLLN